MKTIVAKIYPNGQYSAGECFTSRLSTDFVSLRGIKTRLNRYGKRCFSFSRSPVSGGVLLEPGSFVVYAGTFWVITQIIGDTCVLRTPCGATVNHLITNFRERCDRGEFEVVRGIPLGLSNLSKLKILSAEEVQLFSSPRKKRGSGGLTSHGRRQVKNACYLLEEEVGRGCLSFLTLTVPTLSFVEEHIQVAQSWAYLVHRFMAWLKSRLRAAGLKPKYVYVNEIQEKRYERTGIYAPHLHIVFIGRKRFPSSGWVVSPSSVRKAWLAAISGLLNRPVESRSCENLQRVKYSCAAYLSKYLSKGRSDAAGSEGLPGGGNLCLPSWYGVCRSLQSDIRVRTIRISYDQPQGLIAWALLFRPAELVGAGFLRYGRTAAITCAHNSGADGGETPFQIQCGSGTFASGSKDIEFGSLYRFVASL